MKLHDYQKQFNQFLIDLTDKGVDKEYSDRGFAMPNEIEEDALLFIGLNQSHPYLDNVPFFFSGMITGQRALDLGSLERLKWHVGKVLNEKKRN